MTPAFNRLLILALLTAATLALFQLYERYQPSGPELLTDPTFAEGFAHWERSGRGKAWLSDSGVLRLRVDDARGGVAVRQSLPEAGRYRLLRLSGKLQAQDIQPGPRFWQRGRLVLVSLDGNERMLAVPHLAADLDGTRAWRRYQAVFRVPSQMRTVRVGVQLIGATGVLAVKELSLREVQEKGAFAWYRYASLVLWALVLIWAGLPWLAQWRGDKAQWTIVLLGLTLLVGTLLPGSLKMQLEWATGAALARLALWGWPLSGRGSESTVLLCSDGWHLLTFALFAAAVRRGHPDVSARMLIVWLLTLAAVSETLQFYVDARQPSLIDFAIDSAGLLLGVAAVSLWPGAGRAPRWSLGKPSWRPGREPPG